MSVSCDSLIKTLRDYKNTRPRGALAAIARKSGVSHQVLGRLISGNQKTINYENWKKLHDAEPLVFPAPFDEKLDTQQQLLPTAVLSKYPFVEEIIEDINNAVSQNWSEAGLIQVLIKKLEAYLIICKEELRNANIKKESFNSIRGR